MCTFNHSCCSVLFEALLVEIKPSSLFEYDVGTPICGQFLTFFPTFTRQDIITQPFSGLSRDV